MPTPFFFPQPYSNPEVAEWVARVVAVGSSVSPVSASAHDTFVTALKAAALWTLFTRLNTYGTNTLSGALIPLVGSGSDTNHNFINSDFTLQSGLVPDGATKFLDTGVVCSTLSPTNMHLCFVAATADTRGNKSMIRPNTSTSGVYPAIGGTEPSGTVVGGFNQNTSALPSGGAPSGIILGTCGGTGTPADLYRNGSLQGSVTGGSTGYGSSYNFAIFGAASEFTLSTGLLYSLGQYFTPAQVTAYSSSISTLMTALGRTYPA